MCITFLVKFTSIRSCLLRLLEINLAQCQVSHSLKIISFESAEIVKYLDPEPCKFFMLGNVKCVNNKFCVPISRQFKICPKLSKYFHILHVCNQIIKHSSMMCIPACANRTCFNCQGVGGGGSSSEQGLQWWQPDVTSRGRGSLSNEVPCLGGGQKGSLVQSGPMWGGGLYSEFQCIIGIGNGHMGPPLLRPTEWQKDTCKNITFPHLRWRAVINHKHSA